MYYNAGAYVRHFWSAFTRLGGVLYTDSANCVHVEHRKKTWELSTAGGVLGARTMETLLGSDRLSAVSVHSEGREKKRKVNKNMFRSISAKHINLNLEIEVRKMPIIETFEADQKISRDLNRKQLRDLVLSSLERAEEFAEKQDWQKACDATTTAINAASNIRRRYQNGGASGGTPLHGIGMNQGVLVDGELMYWRDGSSTNFRKVIEHNEEDNIVILSVDKIGLRALNKEIGDKEIEAFVEPRAVALAAAA